MVNKKEGKVKSRLAVVCSVCGAEITHCNKCSKIFEYNEIIICEKTRHYHKDCNDKKRGKINYNIKQTEKLNKKMRKLEKPIFN